MKTPTKPKSLWFKTFRPLVSSDCRDLIELAEPKMKPADVDYGPSSERRVCTDVRRGTRYEFTEPNVSTEQFRYEVAQATCEDVDRVENPVILRYRKGDFFNYHYDGDHRIFTAICFLTRAYEGGELYFPKHDVAVAPCGAQSGAGSGIIFTSHVGHSSTPITAGEKWVLVTWVKAKLK